MTTNSPTETVSDCKNCHPEPYKTIDLDMVNGDMVCAECGKNYGKQFKTTITPDSVTMETTPTVEKWEEEAERFTRAIKTLMKDRKTAYHFMTGWFADLHNATLSHSVQEAKAERDEKAYLLGGIEALTRYLDFVKTRPDKIKFWIEWYKHVLSLDKSAGIDHLSTLNTKESK